MDSSGVFLDFPFLEGLRFFWKQWPPIFLSIGATAFFSSGLSLMPI